jgi:Stage II sporulation protein E (SpoIIE)
MARRFGCAIFLLSVCAIGVLATAQPDAPIAFGKSVAPLNGPWKFQIGDSPADPQTGKPMWAEPNFDDSHWETVDLTPQPGFADPFTGDPRYVAGWTTKGHPNYWGYAWYRIRVRLGAGSANSLAFATYGHMDDAYQLFDHGELVGSWGLFRDSKDSPVTYFTEPVMFALPRPPSIARAANSHFNAGLAEHVLALRFWMGPVGLLHNPFGGGFHSAPLLGEAAAISTRVDLERQMLVRQYYYSAFEWIVFFSLAILVAGLAFFDRSDLVYLWVSGCFLCFTLMSTSYVLANTTQLMSFRTFFVMFQVITNPLSVGGWTMVWWIWFRLRRPTWVPKTIAILTVSQMVTMAFGADLVNDAIPQQVGMAFFGVSVILRLLLAALLVFIVARGIRETGVEGWLVLPAVIPMAAALFENELIVLHLNGSWHFRGVTILFIEAAEMVMAAAVGLLMLRRMLQSVRRQREMAADVKQAQEVQRFLIPKDLPPIPGLEIETEYHPARDVGGDFFQIVQHPTDGSALIVAGDVVGKGLKAGMLVALLVGAIRTATDTSLDPQFVLRVLNKRLLRRGDAQATCLALRIGLDGEATLANAGHVAPYLNGEPFPMEGALPLGMVEAAESSVACFQLNPGDRLILMSDGIAEAMDADGQLFSFERMHELARSATSAADIAVAAQRFGQEDDISVISITRTLVRHPAVA